MKIVDAQVHLWCSGKPSKDHRQIPVFTAEELLAEMDEAGVDAAVINPAGWDPFSNEMAVEAARCHPDRFGVMGHFPLNRPESRGLIDGWKNRPGMLGLRFSLSRPEQQAWPLDGTIDWLWPAAEKAGLPVATMAFRFLPVFRQIAERHPDLRLIIDHLGLVRWKKDDGAFENLEELLSLSGLPNVAVKATGVPGYSTMPYPFRNIHDGLHRIFDAFGPERFFWGSDLTRMRSYRQCITLFTEELPWLSGRDLELVMGRALCSWIGWKLPFH